MNKEHKKNLIIRGTLRTAAAAGMVAGLYQLCPELAPVYLMAGYGSVLASMEATARKMKEAERVDKKLRTCNSSFYQKPKANVLEKLENQLLNVNINLDGKIKDAKFLFNEKLEDFKYHKKQKLMIRNDVDVMKNEINLVRQLKLVELCK